MLNLTSRWICGLLATALALQGPASIALATPAPAPAPSPTFFDDGDDQTSPEEPTVESYLELYAGIFVELFGQPFDQERWYYPLTEHVTAEGTYTGQNHHGQKFEFEALIANKIELSTLPDLTAAQVQQLVSQDVRYTSAQGWIHGPFASVPVDVIVITQSSTGTPATNFMITERLPDNHPLLLAQINTFPPDLPPPPPAEYTLTEPDPTPQVLPEYAHFLDLQKAPEEQAAAIDATFQTLFGSSPAENQLVLPFTANIAGPGDYEGDTAALALADPDAALPFVFEVRAAEPVDVADLPQITGEYAAIVAELGIQFQRVDGFVSTEAGGTYIDALAVSFGDGPSSVFTLAVMQEPGQSSVKLPLICIPIIIPIPYRCLDQDCVDACKAVRDAAIQAALDAFDAAKDAAKTAYDDAVYAANIARTVAKAAASAAYGAALKACATSQASQLLACALVGVLSWFTGGLALVACLARVAAVFAACAAVASAVFAAALVGIDAAFDALTASARAAYDAAIAAAKAARDQAIQDALDAYDACVAACWYICWRFIIIWLCFF